MLDELKTAVVTGACGGIGSHIVRRLRAADITVHAVSHRPAELSTIAQETGSNAIHLMTQNLRMDLFGTDIKVSEILPGRVKTGMHAEMFNGDHERSDALVYSDYECLLPQEIADAVLYMLSAPAHVNISHLEILPTHQTLGGARFHSRSANEGAGSDKWR